jgi:hypothetical protein
VSFTSSKTAILIVVSEAKGAFQEFGGMITEKESEFAKRRQEQRNA